MKKLIAFFLTVFILASAGLPAVQAKTYDSVQAAIDDANRFIICVMERWCE